MNFAPTELQSQIADMIKDFMRSLLSGENNLHEFQKSLIYLVKEQTASRIIENKSGAHCQSFISTQRVEQKEESELINAFC